MWLPLARPAFQRILIFRIGNIGDVLVTVPVLDAIRARFRDVHIALLTSPGRPGAPGAEEVLPRQTLFDELLIYHTPEVQEWRGRIRLLRRLRRGRFDVFIELSNQLSTTRDELRNMMFARFTGCRLAMGFDVSQVPFFLRDQALHISQAQESRRIYGSLEATLLLGPYRDVCLPVLESAREEIADLLSHHGLRKSDDYVVMHVGAKRQTNRWPAERCAYVADEITRRWGLRVVLTGNQSEVALVEDIASRMHENPILLCGQIDLRLMAALLQKARLYVGNDTGPMHLAAAVGAPVVGIFSARDFPDKWYPAGPGQIVLRQDAPCSPCFKEVCDQDLICLKSISADQVLSAVGQQLSRLDVSTVGRAARARE